MGFLRGFLHQSAGLHVQLVFVDPRPSVLHSQSLRSGELRGGITPLRGGSRLDTFRRGVWLYGRD